MLNQFNNQFFLSTIVAFLRHKIFIKSRLKFTKIEVKVLISRKFLDIQNSIK